MLKRAFVETASYPRFDDNSIQQAKELFDEYRAKNVMLDCQFEDESWTISDEYSLIRLDFSFAEFPYRRFYEDLFDMSLDEFTEHVKIFLTGILGQYSVLALKDFLNDVRKIINTDPDAISSGVQLNIFRPKICGRFLNLMIVDEDCNLANVIDKMITDANSGQRTLADFDSYFLFDDILTDYWTSDLDTPTRLFYYPVYLWWELTGIVPTRPREFLVTPRNCLEKRGDGYRITMRKNKLKGHRKRSIKYKISEDYANLPLKINDELAHEIERYIELTNDCESTEIDTLLVTQPHMTSGNANHRPIVDFIQGRTYPQHLNTFTRKLSKVFTT